MRFIAYGTIARIFALIGVLVCLQGCAQITVITDQQPPKSEVRFGVLAVDIGPSAKNAVISASGLGLISTPSGTTLGLADARIIRIGDQCRVVVATTDLDAVIKNPELVRLLRESYKACAA